MYTFKIWFWQIFLFFKLPKMFNKKSLALQQPVIVYSEYVNLSEFKKKLTMFVTVSFFSNYCPTNLNGNIESSNSIIRHMIEG